MDEDLNRQRDMFPMRTQYRQRHRGLKNILGIEKSHLAELKCLCKWLAYHQGQLKPRKKVW